MRGFLLSFILLLTTLNASPRSFVTTFPQKRDSIVVKTPIYEVLYSQKFEQPIWVKYTVKCPNGNYPRKGMDFYTNDTIHTSDDNDYVNNIYDKGHMAPAADFNCDSATLVITFSYLNCALQNENLNRGVWKKLESYERELANTNKVEVKILCVFSKKSIKLSSGATVPDGFYKLIKYSGHTLKYYFPNITPTESDYNKYLVK